MSHTCLPTGGRAMAEILGSHSLSDYGVAGGGQAFATGPVPSDKSADLLTFQTPRRRPRAVG